MALYIRTVTAGDAEVWDITPTQARRREIGWPRVITPQSGEDIFDALRREEPLYFPSGVSTFRETRLNLGEYHPRIARPSISNTKSALGRQPFLATNTNLIADLRTQLTTLTRQLDKICQVIHPDGSNLQCYGHEVRNLLILCCTEVEAHWVGILKSNNYTPSSGRFATPDYVKLCGAMKLNEFELRFTAYPWIGGFRPFSNWLGSTSPTQDIPWYDAYNKVKHDREQNFSLATLQHAMEALSACVIMMMAEFGLYGLDRKSEVGSRYELIGTGPLFDPEDAYVNLAAPQMATWQAVDYPF